MNAEDDLQSLRRKVREIDDDLLGLLVKRVDAARKIGLIKKQNSLPIFDPEREAFNKKRNHEIAQGHLPEPMVDELTDFLTHWAREIQKMVR